MYKHYFSLRSIVRKPFLSVYMVLSPTGYPEIKNQLVPSTLCAAVFLKLKSLDASVQILAKVR